MGLNYGVTFRADEKLKKEAVQLYESLGMNFSTALNMFMRQSVGRKKFPCSIEAEIPGDYSYTYTIDWTEEEEAETR